MSAAAASLAAARLLTRLCMNSYGLSSFCPVQARYRLVPSYLQRRE
jgi:hypothetical protein